MNLILATLLFVLISFNNIWSLNGCKMTIKEADDCGLKGMFFGNRNTIIPANEQELDQHCNIVRDSIKCIRDFASQCLDGYIQQVFNMGLTNAGKHVDKRCKDPNDRTEFLSHVKCLLPREKMEPFHICTDKNLVMMEKLKDVTETDRIATACCIFHSFQDCIRKNNKVVCSDETSDYWDEIINEVADDSISFSCANYENTDKCNKNLNSKVWDDIKALALSDDPKELAQRHKFGSGVAITIEILQNFKM